jgi:propionyl-CoA carboxylase alpha chain
MDIRTVAVYTRVDRGAAHVELADMAFEITGPSGTDGYLSIAALVEAARRAKVDAVHPGIGFLSESADFCRALQEIGITFIGPSEGVLRKAGNKLGAKRAATAAGVSCIPGPLEPVVDAAEALRAAMALGFPVVLKAAAAGGGRSLRLVAGTHELTREFESCRREALLAFGENTIIVERHIPGARHVEVQLVCDRHGAAVAMGDRDCSVQRRHQKLIEEGPAAELEENQRRQLHANALAIARQIGYDSVGTVEFLLDAEGRTWFMEMNARLQVEHAVTEILCGIDLVAEMIRIASGEPLSAGARGARAEGCAIEARICAEDPMRDFLPAHGRITRYVEPLAGAGELRVDSGVREGDRVAPHYDSLLAKVIARGSTRKAAVTRLQAALGQFVIRGVQTNLVFLQAVLRDPKFAGGLHDTHFLDSPVRAEPGQTELKTLIGAALFLHASSARSSFAAVGDRVVVLDGQQYAAGILASGARLKFRCAFGEGEFTASWNPGEPLLEGFLDGQQVSVQVETSELGWCLSLHGSVLATRVLDSHLARFVGRIPPAPRSSGSMIVRSPLPGKVIEVSLSEGQAVRRGDALLVLQAMKMENELRAPFDGKVGRVSVRIGQAVETGAALMEILPDVPGNS